MAAMKKTGCTVLLLAAIGLTVGSSVVCCGGGAVAVWMSPAAFVWMIVEDQPLAVTMPTPEPGGAEATRARVCGDLLAARPTRITGAELTQLGIEGAPPEILVFRTDIVGDELTLDLSVEMEPGQYINLHGKGGFTMDHGWFTDSTMDEATFSGWDLGAYVAGQQMAPDMNRSLANERAKTPELGPLLDAFDSLSVRDGAIELVPNAGAAQVVTLCAPYAGVPDAAVEAVEAPAP